MYSSAAVANRFLELAEAKGDTLTPMQLIKLTYIAHGWMLGLYGRPLVNDPVEAWRYGPVIPYLYGHLRDFRGEAVTGRLPVSSTAKPLDEDAEDVISQVFDVYGGYTGIALSRMTHADGTPWALTYEPDGFSSTIPRDLIQEHYRRLAERSAERAG